MCPVDRSNTALNSGSTVKHHDAIDPRPLHYEVADRLREMITHGELAPGERLNERVLTERFGISRTPLREAVRLLFAEGLVRLLPNRGAIVVTINREDAEDMFQMMASLEALAATLACARATATDIAEITKLHERMKAFHAERNVNEYYECNQRIHEKIVDCAGNRELSVAYRRVSTRVRCPRFNAAFPAPRWREAMDEHDEILDALVSVTGSG
jgi:DNA-binding GntR family transcriptional regulator